MKYIIEKAYSEDAGYKYLVTFPDGATFAVMSLQQAFTMITLQELREDE